MKEKYSLPVLLLGLLCLYHFVVNTTWIMLSTAPLPWDQAGHTRLVLSFVEFFQTGEFLKIINYFSISQYYPPFIHTLVALPVLLLGHPIIISELIITIFFLASLVLLYLYTTDLFQNKTVGILTTTVYSFFPIVVEHSRWFLLETPHLALLLAALLCLRRSQTFQHKNYTKLFFIFAALGMITKWVTLVALALPVLFTVISLLQLTRRGEKPHWQAIEHGITLFLVITLPWYVFNIPNLLQLIPPNLAPESSDPQSLFSLQSLTFYLYLFMNFQLGLYFALASFLGGLWLFFTKHPTRFFILCYMLSTYTIFTFIPNKDWRYTMSMLPFAAMCIGYGLYQLYAWKKYFGIILSSILISFMGLYMFLLSFRNEIGISFQRAIPIPFIGWIDYINLNDNLVRSFNSDKYPQEQILKTINKQPESTKKMNVLCLVDQERFNAGDLSLIRDLQGYKNIEISSPPSTLFSNEDDISTYLQTQQFSYVLLAKERIGVSATRNLSTFIQLKDFIENNQTSTAKLLKEYLLPNRDTILVYRLDTKNN